MSNELTDTELVALDWLVTLDRAFRSSAPGMIKALHSLCKHGLARSIMKPTGLYFRATEKGRSVFDDMQTKERD